MAGVVGLEAVGRGRLVILFASLSRSLFFIQRINRKEATKTCLQRFIEETTKLMSSTWVDVINLVPTSPLIPPLVFGANVWQA